jgi:hypothetical protein
VTNGSRPCVRPKSSTGWWRGCDRPLRHDP